MKFINSATMKVEKIFACDNLSHVIVMSALAEYGAAQFCVSII
jgi:hypothetical protein